jgi:hypothetical protein
MNLLKKICIAVFIYPVVACGDSDIATQVEQEPVLQEKEVNTVKTSPHNIQGMKKVMDDARGIEDLLQKRHEDQQKEINNL